MTQLNEFALIERYFAPQIEGENRPLLGIGDDGALVAVPSAEALVVTTDTLIAGVHFPEDATAATIGHKALAVNLSDLAAMGARPRWFTLSLTLPRADEHFLAPFAEAMLRLAQRYQVALIGGDTVRGDRLAVTIQALGTVVAERALRRSGAKVGDTLYLTGTIGDAAAGLTLWQQQQRSEPWQQQLIERLTCPTPRVEAGLALAGLASAAIDISDGLAADLGHLCRLSGVGAKVDIGQLPRSVALQQWSGASLTDWFNGGDDYELCFSAAAELTPNIAQLADRLGLALTAIGEIVAPAQGVSWWQGGSRVATIVAAGGYRHF
ncbi:thiamine-phosphate kinase [Ectothiorhodospiraceae bacterium BW-2]|nr:thiamine-phosphate kinase [Ectothiorhodospiraceae bacterium BW-2]